MSHVSLLRHHCHMGAKHSTCSRFGTAKSDAACPCSCALASRSSALQIAVLPAISWNPRRRRGRILLPHPPVKYPFLSPPHHLRSQLPPLVTTSRSQVNVLQCLSSYQCGRCEHSCWYAVYMVPNPLPLPFRASKQTASYRTTSRSGRQS